MSELDAAIVVTTEVENWAEVLVWAEPGRELPPNATVGLNGGAYARRADEEEVEVADSEDFCAMILWASG